MTLKEIFFLLFWSFQFLAFSSVISFSSSSFQAQQERELRQMKIELEEMKKQKVKMIRKMKDDTSSRKVTDARKERCVCVCLLISDSLAI